MRKIYCIAVIATLISGCGTNIDGLPPVYRENFIDRYYAVENMSVKRMRDTCVRILIDGEIYSMDSPVPEYRAYFAALAKHHGDTEFKRGVPAVEGVSAIYAEDFASIDVRSNAAWDDAHPAGSSLGDIIWFSSQSYARFIRSGYWGEWVEHIYTPVNKLTEDDLSMLLVIPIILSFKTLPQNREQHTLTVTITTTAGRVLTASNTLAVPGH